MKKLIIGLVFLFGLQSVVSAELISDVTKAGQRNISDVTKPQALSRLQSMGGLTFFKDYANKQASLNADYSVGSPTASFSVTRQATNSTYVGDDGIIYTANTAVNRKNNYYDATGFHTRSGVLLEPAGTNLKTYSQDVGHTSGWTYANSGTGSALVYDDAYTTALDGTQTASRLIADKGAEEDANDYSIINRSVTVSVGAHTFSVWLKSNSGTPDVLIYLGDADGATGLKCSLTNEWKRFSVTRTTARTTLYPGIGLAGLAFATVQCSQTADFLAWGAQLETGSVATSFIPTTTAAVTRNADFPATWVDASGVLQVNATNNTPRFQGGWYDATGFHAGNKGLMVEGAITNLIPKSSTIDDATWTETNTVANNADAGSTSPDGTATAPSLTAGADNGTLLLTTNVTAQTYSVWLKRKTGTGAVTITADGTNYSSSLDVTTSWRRFSVTAASAAQKCGIKLAVNTDAVYVWGNQFEASPYMTSYVPTAGAAMSRTAEVLKYAISGNRTAATETIAIKALVPFAGSATTTGNYLHTTSTKTRDIWVSFASDGWKFTPNSTDSGSVIAESSVDVVANTSVVVTAVAQGTSPYAEIYEGGVSKGTYTTGGFTTPNWGEFFFLGSQNNGDTHLNGIIQSIAIFSTALDATQVASVTNTMNS